MLRKFTRFFLLGSALVGLLVVFGTIVPRPLWRDDALTVSGGHHRILILSNPIHTDIAIPLDAAVAERFGFLRAAGLDVDLPAARYLVFGWGGRAFYTETPTWADLKPLPALKGLTLDSAVMHVELAGAIPPDSPFATQVAVSDAGFDRMLDFVRTSFQEGPQGPILLPGVAYGRFDLFFEATGYFNAFLGCNTWTAAALRQAGLRTGLWPPLPRTLLWSLHLHNHDLTPGGV